MCTQSFAAATAAGSAVYVGLRELCLRGVALPLSVRVLMAAGTTVTVRVLDYYAEGGLLPPMHGRADVTEEARDAAQARSIAIELLQSKPSGQFPPHSE